MTPFVIACGIVIILCAVLVYISLTDNDFCTECQMYHDNIPD